MDFEEPVITPEQREELQKINEQYYLEEDKYWTKVKHDNDRIFRAIEKDISKKFLKNLMECLKDSEWTGSALKLVRYTKGQYQNDKYGKTIKGLWVDQTTNGGFSGDDYAGDIYVELRKGLFLKAHYEC